MKKIGEIQLCFQEFRRWIKGIIKKSYCQNIVIGNYKGNSLYIVRYKFICNFFKECQIVLDVVVLVLFFLICLFL